MTLQIYQITALYFEYNVAVSMVIEHNSELPFPAVTLCNMSPLRRSRWEQHKRTYSSLDDVSPANVPSVLNRKRRSEGENCSAVSSQPSGTI